MRKQLNLFPFNDGKLGKYILYFFPIFMQFIWNVIVILKKLGYNKKWSQIFTFQSCSTMFDIFMSAALHCWFSHQSILKLGWFYDKLIHNSCHLFFLFLYYLSTAVSSLEWIYTFTFFSIYQHLFLHCLILIVANAITM